MRGVRTHTRKCFSDSFYGLAARTDTAIMGGSGYREDVLRMLVRATHQYYSFMLTLERTYADTLKRVAANYYDPDSGSNITAPVPIDPLHLPRNLPAFVSIKKAAGGVKPYKESSAMARASIKRLNKMLTLKAPVTHGKLVKLMGLMDIPVEKYIALRVDVMVRKYLTGAMKRFVEVTYGKHFFNTAPPFAPVNRVHITWDNELRGLMKTAVDVDGLIVKKPTERLTGIIRYAQQIVGGAYYALFEPVPGSSDEATFVNCVTTYNGYASLVNNISSELRYNASSLIFTYFKKASATTRYSYIRDLLADIRGGTRDVEKALMGHVVDAGLAQEDTDVAVADPYNVVAFGGFPYEQIRAALRCEFVLLKVLFYVGDLYGSHVKTFLEKTYEEKYVGGGEAFAVNNVLQLCPGLMTLIFYALVDDGEGKRLAAEANKKFRVLTTSKGHLNKQEAVELHKNLSGTLELMCVRFMDVVAIGNVKIKETMMRYANLLFMRSGLIRNSGAAAELLYR